jgi:hypothetical protein
MSNHQHETRAAYDKLIACGMPEHQTLRYRRIKSGGAGIQRRVIWSTLTVSEVGEEWCDIPSESARDLLECHAMRWLREELAQRCASSEDGNQWLILTMPLWGSPSYLVHRESQSTAIDLEGDGEDLLDAIVEAVKAMET